MNVGYIVRQLRAAGADAEIVESGIELDGKPVHLQELGSRPATPSDLKKIVEASRARRGTDARRPVVSATRASPRTLDWLKSHLEVVLVLNDMVVIEGIVHRLGETPQAAPRRRGPRPYARVATARVLLAGVSRRDQISLAELAGVTQGSVSNALRRIPEIQSPGDRFDELVGDYPGPGGQAYYWWSSAPLQEQARHLGDSGALLSGDFAADRIAPWRMPERVVAYLDTAIDLSVSGYVLADAHDYTTLVVVPEDPTLRATASIWSEAGDVVDPIIAAYDVLRTATTGDQDEAVGKLREVVIARFEEAQRA